MLSDNQKDAELFETLRLLEELNSGELSNKFEDIIDFLEDLYFKEDKEWICTYSGGKDSSLVLSLVFKMLKRLTKEKRFKRVHIVSADTKVESYQMTSYLKKNLKLIKKYEDELNIVVHLVEPDLKNSFFWNVLGKGVVAPKPPSPFQWCTKKMKINPMNKKLEQILTEAPVDLKNVFSTNEESGPVNVPYDAIMLLGSRLDESSKRARSINKYSFDDKDVFARNPDFNNVRMCYPIKFVLTSDLWAYLTSEELLPWGLPSQELLDMYSDGSGECPMTREELSKTKGCGSTNSRNGCWVCLFAGENDKMLETLISAGHKEVRYLAEWKAFLYNVTYDVRYREPLRRIEVNRNTKKLEQAKTETLDIFSFLGDNPYEKIYSNYERANKTHYEPGGFTFELRLKLLQKLLFTQEKVGYKLIENEELNAVLNTWEDEGYLFSMEDIKPINHQYDGQVVLKKDGSINKKETKNENEIFFVTYQFKMGEKEMIDYVKERQKITGKSFYCFFGHKEYEEERLVYNSLKVVVCKDGINTQREANQRVFEWLYGNEKELMENKAFEAGIDMLLLQAIEESLISRKSFNQ